MGFLQRRLRAIVYAFSGISQAFGRETHLKIQGLLALVAINCGFYFSISKSDWLLVLLCITLVIAMEMVNSAIEKLCDRLVPDRDPNIKYVKDVTAGAVLIACIFAVCVGFFVFVPYVSQLLK